MTPEQLKQMEDMEKEIAVLKDFVLQLKSANHIPLEIEESFKGRFRFTTGNGLGSAGAQQTLSLSGNPQSIQVPANPSGTFLLRDSFGNIHELLVK